MSDVMNIAPMAMNRSPEIKDLAAALVKAQAAMEGAKKDSTNPHFKSAYADLASVWDAIRGPLTANGLAVMQWPRTLNNGVEIETMLVHSSGQYISDTLSMPAKMDAHGIGSALTYARRYALMAIAGVAPVDDDGNAAGANAAFQAPPKRQGWAGSDGPVDPMDAGLTENGPKFTAGQVTRIKKWLEGAHGTLQLTGQTPQSLGVFRREQAAKFQWVEDNMPEESEKLEKAYQAALDAAQARMPAANSLMAG